MSCLLSKGRQITCRDTVGGIKNAYFFRFQDITSSTIANSELTDLEGIDNIKKYILKIIGNLMDIYFLANHRFLDQSPGPEGPARLY